MKKQSEISDDISDNNDEDEMYQTAVKLIKNEKRLQRVFAATDWL